jgi:LCP family protein required for cell wall assembly
MKRLSVASLFGSLFIFILIIGLPACSAIKKKWQAPLGPGLELPTHTPTQPATATIESTPVDSTREPTSLVETPSITPIPATLAAIPTSTPEPLCGGPAVMYILGIGADADPEYLYGLADAIRIARIDFVTPKVTVLSLSRDLWVELPPNIGVSGRDPITNSKLNQAYFYGSKGMGYYDGPGEGPGLLARTLDQNYGIRADQYGAVNMEVFKKIVDAVGGIDIYLPTDVDGRPIDEKTEDMGYFYAGQQHFNGDQALRFSRIRKKYNDFTRMDHQNMVICALKKKILSPSILPKIPQVVNAFVGEVQTDLSLEQISQLLCLLPKIESQNLIFTGLPQEIMKPGRVFSPIQNDQVYIEEADPAVIRDYMNQFIAGTWPAQDSGESTCP